MKIAIIGAGASGVMCALRIKELSNYEVDLYEKDSKILKKVAASGGGRCNLGNTLINEEYFNNKLFIKEFIIKIQNNDYLSFFKRNNFLTATEGNLIYPHTFKSKTVVEFLSDLLNDKKVNLILNTEIKDLDYKNRVVNNIKYDFIVIANGSSAHFNNNPYSLLKDLKVTDLKPSLVGFKSKMINNLKNLRVKAKVSLVRNDKVIKAEVGEIQFKDDGLSGICVMNLSSYYLDDDYLEIDFFHNYTTSEIKELILNKNLTKKNCFKYFLDEQILNLFNLNNQKIDCLNSNELDSFINTFKKFKLEVNGLYDFSKAQVVRGGLDLSELSDFELNKYKKVFLIGEIIDINGLCGGYNLWFAFNSGLYVGEKICKY